MTPHKSNQITFTRGTLSITATNEDTTMVEGYEDIVVSLLISDTTTTPFLWERGIVGLDCMTGNCCTQHTDMYGMVVETLLIAIFYLSNE
jgi:hypothetical protein